MAKFASFDVAVPSLLSKVQRKAFLGRSYDVLPMKLVVREIVVNCARLTVKNDPLD